MNKNELKQIKVTDIQSFQHLFATKAEVMEKATIKDDDGQIIPIQIIWINRVLNLGYAIGIGKNKETQDPEMKFYKIGNEMIWSTFADAVTDIHT